LPLAALGLPTTPPRRELLKFPGHWTVPRGRKTPGRRAAAAASPAASNGLSGVPFYYHSTTALRFRCARACGFHTAHQTFLGLVSFHFTPAGCRLTPHGHSFLRAGVHLPSATGFTDSHFYARTALLNSASDTRRLVDYPFLHCRKLVPAGPPLRCSSATLNTARWATPGWRAFSRQPMLVPMNDGTCHPQTLRHYLPGPTSHLYLPLPFYLPRGTLGTCILRVRAMRSDRRNCAGCARLLHSQRAWRLRACHRFALRLPGLPRTLLSTCAPSVLLA